MTRGKIKFFFMGVDTVERRIKCSTVIKSLFLFVNSK